LKRSLLLSEQSLSALYTPWLSTRSVALIPCSRNEYRKVRMEQVQAHILAGLCHWRFMDCDTPEPSKPRINPSDTSADAEQLKSTPSVSGELYESSCLTYGSIIYAAHPPCRFPYTLHISGVASTFGRSDGNLPLSPYHARPALRRRFLQLMCCHCGEPRYFCTSPSSQHPRYRTALVLR